MQKMWIADGGDGCAHGTRASHGLVTRAGACALGVALAVSLMSALPGAAHAQFGALKRIKNAISPDSAAKVENARQDSIALAAKRAAGDTTPLGPSKLSRAMSAAAAAGNKFEAVTGVSAKDAALAATGVGAGNILARKMGLDPMAFAANAMNGMSAKGAVSGAVNGAVNGAVGGAMSNGMMQAGAGVANAANMAAMQRMAAAQGRAAASVQQESGGDVSFGPGMSERDARAIAAFQQDMMQVALAANAGDPVARARLERWQAIAVGYQAEVQRLSVAASAGDMAAVQRLQVIQMDIIRKWAGTASAVPASKATRAKASAKP